MKRMESLLSCLGVLMGGNEMDRREQSFLSILLKSQIFKE